MRRVVCRMMLVATAVALSIAAPGLAQSKAALPDVPNPLVVEAADAGRFGGTFVVTIYYRTPYR